MKRPGRLSFCPRHPLSRRHTLTLLRSACQHPASVALFMRRHRLNLPATLRLHPNPLEDIAYGTAHVFLRVQEACCFAQQPLVCRRIVSGWQESYIFLVLRDSKTDLDLSLSDLFNVPRTPTDVLFGIKKEKKRAKSYYLFFELYQQPTSSDITNFTALWDDPFILISTQLWKGTLKHHIIITLHSMEETNCCILLWTLKC